MTDEKHPFHQVKEGEWIQPSRNGYLTQCCDCGVVHRMNFRLVKKGSQRKIQLQAFRADDVVVGDEEVL